MSDMTSPDTNEFNLSTFEHSSTSDLSSDSEYYLHKKGEDSSPETSINNTYDHLQIETCDEDTVDSIPLEPTWDKESTIYQDKILRLTISINDNKLRFKLRKNQLQNTMELINVILYKLKTRDIYPSSLHLIFKDKSLNSIELYQNGVSHDPELLLEYIQLKKNLYIRANIE
ncbi:hypothetical protein JA1_002123 [Spathaspora sp. JA1]|nr:hypothetical protein JA1_002123 [Spathaspora sp. JA1]